MRVSFGVDLSQMRSGMDRLIDAYAGWPEEKQADFAARYKALTGAGAEWVDVFGSKGGVSATVSDDLRRLCAEFALTL